ncbi:VTT domain-containing protein [Chloroflexota bacterium]
MATTNNQAKPANRSNKKAYFLGILGVVLTIAMAVAVVYFRWTGQELRHWGYLGAFLISILGGATIIIPVPMLAVVFALGSVMKYTWLVGIAAGLGETLGALTIYMTGHGGGIALANSRHGKIQAAYERLLGLMERRGSITLFLLSAVINPFFYPAALAAGATKFGIRKYFIVCFVGKTIKGMTVVYVGYWGLGSLLRWLGMPV